MAQASVIVEADLYSGRPNPAWRLDAAEASELEKRLNAAPRDSAPAPPLPDRLGYRGLRITLIADDGWRSVRVDRGRIHDEDADAAGALHARDADGALERWLLSTGREELGEPLFTQLARA